MRNRIRTSILAAVAALALLFVGVSPANAAGLATATIGSKTAVSITNSWHSFSPNLAHDSKLIVHAYFSNHTANSVKITSFKVCYQTGPNSSVAVNPQLRNASGNFWGGNNGWVDLKKGNCHTWYPNKVYSKQSNGEIVRVTTYLGGSVDVIAGFYR